MLYVGIFLPKRHVEVCMTAKLEKIIKTASKNFIFAVLMIYVCQFDAITLGFLSFSGSQQAFLPLRTPAC